MRSVETGAAFHQALLETGFQGAYRGQETHRQLSAPSKINCSFKAVTEEDSSHLFHPRMS